MKRTFWSVALVGAVLLSAAPGLADGDFYVIAGGGGVGTKITSLPYTINSPGFYYLSGNLSYSGTSHGITVNSHDVTLDLMGFRLSGPGSGSSSIAINIIASHNVEVRNGSINGWSRGLQDSGGARSRAFNLRVDECSYGIILLGSGCSLVKGCILKASLTGIHILGGVATGNVVTNCGYSISGFGTISGNFISNSAWFGINCNGASGIIGNTVVITGNYGIYIDTTDPCLVTQNTVSGPGTHFHGGSGTVNVPNTNAGF